MVYEQLSAALAAEEAAIYAYGVVGVRLATEADRTQARSAEQIHRARRADLVAELAKAKVTTPPAPAAYELPFPVIDRPSALKLAIHVEDGVAAAWRAVLPATQAAGRASALAALIDAAIRATRWRRTAGVTPLTLPFPGQPT